jgi:hypothetical protein
MEGLTMRKKKKIQENTIENLTKITYSFLQSFESIDKSLESLYNSIETAYRMIESQQTLLEVLNNKIKEMTNGGTKVD